MRLISKTRFTQAAGGALVENGLKCDWVFENKDSLVVYGEVITGRSSVALMRADAEYLGVSKGGSKASIWSRLNQAVQKEDHLPMLQVSQQIVP